MADTCSDGSPGSSLCIDVKYGGNTGKEKSGQSFLLDAQSDSFYSGNADRDSHYLAGGVGILTIVLGKGSKQKREEES